MHTNEQHRVLIIDDHPIVRDGIRRLIEMNMEMMICGETGNGNEVMSLIAQCNPSVIILDLTLEGADGLALIGQIYSKYPKIPILVLSIHSETTHALRCIQAGARGYLMKKSASQEIITALQKILQGTIYISDIVKDLLIHSIAKKKNRIHISIDNLSPREFQVFCLYGEGLQTIDIAQKLQCSPKTIETHCLRIRNKLGFKSLSELISHAGAHVKNL